MKNIALLTFLAFLANCATADRELTFAGHLTPKSGICDPASDAVLTLLHQAVVFAPNAGTLVLHGTLAPSGHLIADRTLPGIDHKPYRLLLDADRAGDAITGTYTTPRCHYAVALVLTAN